MRTKRDIQILIESGLSSDFVSKLDDNQTKSLVKRINKKETNEITMVSKEDKSTQSNLQSEKKPYEVYEKTEMTEKFKSKDQQEFFWAKCNTSKGVKKKKWCELAKEFSDKTTKKDYKNMPDHISEGFYDLFKKKPPKVIEDAKLKNELKTFIVKYSKIKDIESDIENWSDKKIIDKIKGYADVSKHGVTHNKRAKEFYSKLFEKKKEKTNEEYEKFLEDRIVEMIEKRIEPKMTKNDILKTISEKIGKNSSMILRSPKKMSMFSKESGIESKRMKTPTQIMPIMGTMEENETKKKEVNNKPNTIYNRKVNSFNKSISTKNKK